MTICTRIENESMRNTANCVFVYYYLRLTMHMQCPHRTQNASEFYVRISVMNIGHMHVLEIN